MAHPYHHALASVKKWGGEVSDYLPLHTWFGRRERVNLGLAYAMTYLNCQLYRHVRLATG